MGTRKNGEILLQVSGFVYTGRGYIYIHPYFHIFLSTFLRNLIKLWTKIHGLCLTKR